MSYGLVVAEVRRGQFEERNLDSLGLCNALEKDIVLLLPDGPYGVNENSVDAVLKVKVAEHSFLNPMNFAGIYEKVVSLRGTPDVIIFTHSSSGSELASYAAGRLDLPLVTDVSGFDKERGVFFKSYYSDKIFGEFRPLREGPYAVTVRSGSFKELARDKGRAPAVHVVEDISATESRSFIEYVEEEKGEIDITKAEFLLSVGRGIGSKDEIPDYEELTRLLGATLSGSRPVIDKQWLPKARQVGTSGKTVKPKVYFAMGISGAFQHIAGMKDAACIVAVNKDPEAPIFQYAHFGVVGDANKLRDKLREIVKGK
jgi:electron transfer flavoprotein alpha subunit